MTDLKFMLFLSKKCYRQMEEMLKFSRCQIRQVVCVIYGFVYVSHISVCTSCHWQVACSGWWIITILYTSNIRNTNISFHLKPHFCTIFTSCIIWQEHLLLIHAPQTFLSEWKNFCNVFLWHSRGCTAIFWLFSYQKFQHKHRLTNKKRLQFDLA